MKTLLRAFAVLAALLCVRLEAGNLTVSITPSQAVSAGARWRVDSGIWRTSGATVGNLTNATHTVDFKSVTGWVAPSAISAVITNGQTTLLTANYFPTASLQITLAPGSGRWRVDSGSWQASGTTLANIQPGSHSVDYASVTGYLIPAAETVNLDSGQTATLIRSYVQLAQLSIALTPTSGRWRIDGSSWHAGTVTVTNIVPGSHLVEYLSVSGYSSPDAETIDLSAGQSLALSRNYVQLAKLKTILSPTGGQWRLDGGAWQTSGTTLSNLAVGTHDIDYAVLAGYTSPISESVSLTSGQTLTVNRTYTKVAQLSITLTPGSGQWQVDGGAWLASGATATNLAAGSHTVSYSPLTNYSSPAPETVNLTAGQSLTFARGYVQFAQISISLAPSDGQWRVNGGAWQASGTSLWVLPGNYLVEYSALALYDSPASENLTLGAGSVFATTRSYTSQKPALRMNLIPSAGQWRVDGGEWNASGALVTELAIGNHTVDYTDIGGAYAPIPSETVSLAARENATLSRTYPAKPPATLSIVLNPSTAQWRVDGGVWQASGSTVTGLSYGTSHTIDYATVAGYTAPASESLTLLSGEQRSLVRNYVQLAEIKITLAPSGAQWRANGGAWQNSGASLFVPAGDYTIDYSDLDLHDTPPSETITVVAGGIFTTTRSYVSQKPTLRITLSPVAGQWRVDGGAWQPSGNQVTELDVGSHGIDYVDLGGNYNPLASETVALALRQNASLNRTYSIKSATVTVTLTPSQAQWKIYLSGATPPETWQNSGASVTGLVPGNYVIEYAAVDGYDEPDPELVELTAGQLLNVARDYAALAGVSVSANPGGIAAQWRIDNGAWQDVGLFATNLSFGVPHTIDFSDVVGYVTPPAQTVTLVSGEYRFVSGTYAPLAGVSVSANPGGIGAQWRIDGGAWQDVGLFATNLAFGVPHTIDFSDVVGYVTAPSQTVTLVSGEYRFVSGTYAPLAGVSVSANPGGIGAQWRIDGGAWQDVGQFATNLAFGVPHTIDFSDVVGYVTAPSQTVTLVSGEYRFVSGTYAPLAGVSVSANPGGIAAQWRIDNGAWQNVGLFASNLSFGVPHTIEFSDVVGYVTPPAQTVTLISGEYRSISGTYAPLAGVSVSANPGGIGAQWRIDGGAWKDVGQFATNLSFGVAHTIDFSDVVGYVTPPAQTVTLASGEYRSVYATYTPLASFSVFLNPNSAQWRVDGGAWNSSGSYLSSLAVGSHTVDYSTLPGYDTPPSESVDLVSGYNPTLSRSYTISHPASVTVTLTPVTGLWQISAMGTASGIWNGSGATVSNLLPGNYTISYSAVAGYDEPVAETIAIAPDENKSITRNYAVSVFATIATNRDSGGSNPSGTSAGTATTTAILGSDGYLYYSAYAEPAAGYGHIFRMAQDGSGYQELKRFGTNPSDGFEPRALFEGSDGVLYGCTKNSVFNSSSSGTIYRINRDGSGYVVLRTFFFNDGNPNALIEGSDGLLYGTTESGGGNFNGTVFRINKDGTGYAVLTTFSISYGIGPQGLVEGPGGMLYGTAKYRGAGSNGALFKLNKDGSGFSVFKSFAGGTDGSTPCAALVASSDGVLYGTASLGGINNFGLVFRINPDGTGYQNLHSFTGAVADGSNPQTSLTEDASGVLYGVTLEGGASHYGTLFKLNKNGTNYTRLLSLSAGTNDGGWPRQRLVVSPTGKLFGSGSIGGTLNNGLLFSLNSNGSSFAVLHQNGTQYAVGPYYRLMTGSDGSVFGTTTFGGTKRLGTLYRTTADGTGYTVLHAFDDAADGGLPVGQVTEASDGLLYGTTYGLQSADGTLYKISGDGSGYSVIHHFDGAVNGRAAWSGVVEGNDGAFYGTCTGGGTSDLGAVYRVNKDGSGFALIHSFIGGAGEGAAPKAELIQAADGRLYGTTSSGGVVNLGTVFVLNPDGSGFTTLKQFSGGSSDGANPISPLLQASDGNLYGTTQAVSGQNSGTVYGLATDGTNYAVLKIFTGGSSNGSDPVLAGVVEKAGKLYGTTARGGTFDQGTIYSMNLDGTGYQIWINIVATVADGVNPSSGLCVANNGMMYGTAYYGGRIASTWTIFRFAP